MAYTKNDNGFYEIPIIALGERLRDNFGLTIKEHSHFDEVDNVHASNSYHDYDEAIDVQDWRSDDIDGVSWRDRTKNLTTLMAGTGAEVLGPGTKGHESHLHLAAKNGIFKLNETQYNTLFGGNAGGKSATFASPSAGSDSPPVMGEQPRVEAKERAQEYSKMSKAEMNTAYDQMRASDPAKAATEGMKMHKAFFGK